MKFKNFLFAPEEYAELFGVRGDLGVDISLLLLLIYLTVTCRNLQKVNLRQRSKNK